MEPKDTSHIPNGEEYYNKEFNGPRLYNRRDKYRDRSYRHPSPGRDQGYLGNGVMICDWQSQG